MTRQQIDQYIAQVMGKRVAEVTVNGRAVAGDVQRKDFDTITIVQRVKTTGELRPPHEGTSSGIPYRIITELEQ